MTYIIEKPRHRTVARTVAAVVLIVSVAGDAIDGVLDFDYAGPVKMVEAVGSSLATGPAFTSSPAWIENQVIGGGYEVTPPENQYVGKLFSVHKST